jgi:hypothetical protein
MKKQNLLRMAAVTLAVSAAFVACDKDEDPIVNPTEPTTSTVEIKVAATQTDNVLQVAYEKTLDLGTIFSLEQPEGGTATLAYTIDEQPSYVEGNNEEYTTVDAYSVSGGVLTAKQSVRVPDAVSAGDDRVRVVREGILKVSAEGATALTYTIQMTNKPALVPVITLAEGSEGQLAGGTLTLPTSGLSHPFTAAAFDIAPIDFGIEDIRVGIGAAGDGDYITISEYGGVPQAGGVNGKPGTGGFIVAHYKGNTLEEVLADETLPQAKLYINVTRVAPTAPIGIEVDTENSPKFTAGNGNQKQLTGFVKVKLDNGEYIAAGSIGSAGLGNFTFVSGYYSQTETGTDDIYTVSSGKPYPEDAEDAPWRTGNLKVNNTNLPAGTTVTFKVSLAKIVKKIEGEDVTTEYLGQGDWTVEVSTTLQEPAQ